MLRITPRVALAVALSTTVAIAAGTATASAATTISGLPETAPIINQLYVPIPITISCDPFSYYYTAASVTIREVVSGKETAHGTASISGLICDGTPQDYTIGVFPDSASPYGTSASPLFKKGGAALSAQVSSGFGTAVTAGPQPLTLTR